MTTQNATKKAETPATTGIPASQTTVIDGNFGLARVIVPGASALPSVRAYTQVCRNLGWDQSARWFVFAHTHQPLDGVGLNGTRVGPRFWNTGS